MSSPIKSAAAAAAEQSTAPGINGSVALTHTNGNQTAQQSTAVAQAPLTNAAAPVAQSMAANPTPLDAKRSQKNNSGSHSSSNGGSLSSSTPGGTAAAVGELAQPIVAKMRRLIDAKKPFYSFEYFPPKTEEGVFNLYTRIERMASLEPLFMDVTWGAGGSTADLTLKISGTAQQLSGSCEVMMHLTCTNIIQSEVKVAIEKAKALGIRNILALRGDPPHGADVWEATEGGFAHAVDLVRYIRQEYGNYFGIAVAGYPEGHISATSLDDDIAHLKEKCDAGADFIITQLFFDADLFLAWVRKCRTAGITVPIVPGIMPIQNYNSFVRMTGFCKTAVPKSIWAALEPLQHNDELVKEYGIHQCSEMCKQLLASGEVQGLHFYTLNLERSVHAVLVELGYITAKPPAGALPWKQSQVVRRAKEQVRPIFWSNRPSSYLERTVHWNGDEYPNGRWGDSRSPAFGDLTDYHLCNFRAGSKKERQKLWGAAPQTEQDVYSVFADFVRGKIARLPWCDTQLQLETQPLTDRLARINASGYLTINSQPRVNGVQSSDAAVGWGGPGGYVYQKAYLEFFCSKAKLDQLTDLISSSPRKADYASLSYTAVTNDGKIVTSLADDDFRVNAVTWGVFPNREILQPTIVDVDVFVTAWKGEAFALWTSVWASAYDDDSASSKLIHKIKDEFVLCNIVDNDYMKDSLYQFFEELCSTPKQ